jgi:hypothetical protein
MQPSIEDRYKVDILPSVDPLNTYPLELTNHPSSPTVWLEKMLPRLTKY